LNADDPWQCLATCFELAAALRSEDPTAYVCKLPIHQDGSCNGLQHYAALGGDLEGAKQVNLEPSDRPQDVYSGVAELVAADIERQAQEGNEIAIALRGKIARKTVKQTVMTNVYGVTFVGAKAQIYRALKDKGDVDSSILGVCLCHVCKLIIVGGGSYCPFYICMSQRHVPRSSRNSRVA
jgi:DNA-directed RNA polymerase, mitochondrial